MVQTASEIGLRIASGKPFQWVRYGNGEWDLILGRGTRTGSGSQVFSEDLREAMRETVRHHHGKIMAMQSSRYLRKLRLWQPVQDWLRKEGIRIDWQHGDILHRASGAGELAPFIRALRDPVFVGPRHLEDLPIPGDVLVIPERNAWLYADSIEDDIRTYCQARTVCVSAGPLAKVLIHRLRHEDMQLIDTGSLWDVYCGQPSRKYHRAMTDEIIEANLHA